MQEHVDLDVGPPWPLHVNMQLKAFIVGVTNAHAVCWPIVLYSYESALLTVAENAQSVDIRCGFRRVRNLILVR